MQDLLICLAFLLNTAHLQFINVTECFCSLFYVIHQLVVVQRYIYIYYIYRYIVYIYKNIYTTTTICTNNCLVIIPLMDIWVISSFC